MNRVFITGIGAVTPVGNNAADTWQGIKEGRLGIGKVTQFSAEATGISVAAEVKDFDPSEYISPREARRLDRFSQLAFCAAMEAWNDSGITTEGRDALRMGTMLGSGMGGLLTITEQHSALKEQGPRAISPLFIPKSIINLAAGYISMKLGLLGPCLAVVSACASGTDSIGQAFTAVRDGTCDFMLAGGAESVLMELAVMGFAQMQALSESADPTRASIPFDRERTGFVMGEGAAFLALESEESAMKRGAKIIAEVAGYGRTCDAYHITAPRADGTMASAAMRQAVSMGGCALEDIDYINAHGTSTQLNDATETRAIHHCFGEHTKKLAVSSTKSMTGHMLGAAGAVEALITAKALQEGFMPPTIGLESPDPECDLDYVPKVGRVQDIRCALTNSFGFGGHNAVLLIKKV